MARQIRVGVNSCGRPGMRLGFSPTSKINPIDLESAHKLGVEDLILSAIL